MSIRMEAGRGWSANVARHASDPAAALEPLSKMVELMPALIWRGVGRETQESLLRDHAGLSSSAAAAALAADHPEQAVQLLEQSRALLWAQQGQDRSDLSALRDIAPDVADELAAIRRDFADLPDNTTEALDRPNPRDLDRRVALAIRWDEAVATVRRLPGFEAFPGVATADPLTAALGGPIVMVNLHHGCWGSHALVVTTDGIQAISLQIADGEAAAYMADYLGALEDADRDPGISARRNLEKTMTRTLEWIWDTIADPVLTTLGFTETPPDGAAWPRLWWCPTGLLTMLPLHAAGYHGGVGGR